MIELLLSLAKKSTMIRFEENFPLKDYNTFGLEAKAKYFFDFTEEEDLPYFLSSFEKWQDSKLLLLGGGSNLLFVHDFDGLVIHPNVPGINVIREDKNNVWLEVGSGENWDEFVEFCVCHGYCGIENLSLIPGNVGAAPVQNIGAYGVEVQDFVETVKGFDLKTFDLYEIPASECQFAYRDSIFKNRLKGRFVVTSVIFKLDKFADYKLKYGDLKEEVERRGGESLKNVRDAVIAIRQSKLPEPDEMGNAGSFFKNPIVENELVEKLKSEYPKIPVYSVDESKSKLAAGWMIDQCGWKGYRDGDAGVHKDQALVLVNYGNATGAQLVDLSDKIRKSVLDKFGVSLHPEVNVVC